ncbi:MAG TPA: threonine synthase [Casimicrobiaceae bacterium]
MPTRTLTPTFSRKREKEHDARSYLSHLECARCAKTYSPHVLQGTCACGAPLLCRYHLDALRAEVDPRDLLGRPATLWRYGELLPVQQLDRAVTLGEGFTPLVPLQWGERHGMHDLWFKDEGRNPTGTFKARGAAVGVTRLRELGVARVVVSSSGNAGDAWAAYCRRAGIEVTVFLPDDAPAPTLVEAALTGEDVHTFGGHNSRGGRLANAFASSRGGFCANTFQEPYRVEGKKTMGLELAEQLGWRMPDVVVYPIGGGVGLIGIWKAFNELLELGWIEGPLPRFVVSQYSGCAPIVEAFRANRSTCEPWGEISTLPGGLRAPKPLADFLVLRILRETGGAAVAVSNEDALAAVREVMVSDGAFICPEAATTIVALRGMLKSGEIRSDERVVVINTGTGLKYASLLAAPINRVDDAVEEI